MTTPDTKADLRSAIEEVEELMDELDGQIDGADETNSHDQWLTTQIGVLESIRFKLRRILADGRLL